MEEMIEINGIDYLVAKRINYNGKVYLYVISNENGNKFSILNETTYDNGDVFIESVNDENLVKEILTLIADQEI